MEPVTFDYIGYLQHDKGTDDPFCIEPVGMRRYDCLSGLAVWFEGRWRRVHVRPGRTFIVFNGEKIDIHIPRS